MEASLAGALRAEPRRFWLIFSSAVFPHSAR
jgi:hypothetical protein